MAAPEPFTCHRCVYYLGSGRLFMRCLPCAVAAARARNEETRHD